MIKNLEQIFSVRAQNMKRSAIREVLKLTQRPDVISFAGGLPSPESFPINQLVEITKEILETDGPRSLQYSATEGVSELREVLIKRYRNQGIELDMDNLLIITSSQQGLDLLGKIFIDRGDKIICGLPSYLGGLSAFRTYGAELVGVKFDEQGMRADKLEETIQQLQQNGESPKFIYIIPDFQNPAGITMPEKRRLEILDIAKKNDILIVEDSPYREVRFEGEPQKMLYQLDQSGQVITLGTFSKIFVPGFRLGWAMGHPDIIDKMVIAKQSADLCTPTFNQLIAAKYIEKGYFDQNLKNIISEYREKRDNMVTAFKTFMPEGVTWTEPEGGLFLFLHLPEGMDSEVLFKKAIKYKVAFVIGSVFHCDGSGKNTMRINFSYMSKEKTREGVQRLAKAIQEEMKKMNI